MASNSTLRAWASAGRGAQFAAGELPRREQGEQQEWSMDQGSASGPATSRWAPVGAKALNACMRSCCCALAVRPGRSWLRPLVGEAASRSIGRIPAERDPAAPEPGPAGWVLELPSAGAVAGWSCWDERLHRPDRPCRKLDGQRILSLRKVACRPAGDTGGSVAYRRGRPSEVRIASRPRPRAGPRCPGGAGCRRDAPWDGQGWRAGCRWAGGGRRHGDGGWVLWGARPLSAGAGQAERRRARRALHVRPLRVRCARPPTGRARRYAAARARLTGRGFWPGLRRAVHPDEAAQEHRDGDSGARQNTVSRPVRASAARGWRAASRSSRRAAQGEKSRRS